MTGKSERAGLSVSTNEDVFLCDITSGIQGIRKTSKKYERMNDHHRSPRQLGHRLMNIERATSRTKMEGGRDRERGERERENGERWGEERETVTERQIQFW